MCIEVKVKEDGIWLHFDGVNVVINVDKLIKMSGPITAKELKAWKASVMQEHQDREWGNARDA